MKRLLMAIVVNAILFSTISIPAYAASGIITKSYRSELTKGEYAEEQELTEPQQPEPKQSEPTGSVFAIVVIDDSDDPSEPDKEENAAGNSVDEPVETESEHVITEDTKIEKPAESEGSESTRIEPTETEEGTEKYEE